MLSTLLYVTQRGMAGWQYRRWGRMQLADVIVAAGVTADMVIKWLRAQRRRLPRYRWFLSHLERDRSLRLLGQLSWYAHPRQLAPPDEG